MSKPEKLILDYSKWICGGDGENKLGRGSVALLNKEGFMCYLGQWSIQCGAPEAELLNNGEPHEITTLIPLFCQQKYNPDFEDNGRRDTILSNKAIGINDDEDTTPEEKIEKLSELLKTEGIELEVINKP